MIKRAFSEFDADVKRMAELIGFWPTLAVLIGITSFSCMLACAITYAALRTFS